MGICDANYWHPWVDHQVTHKNNYACNYNSYGYDCAENGQNPDKGRGVLVSFSLGNFSLVHHLRRLDGSGGDGLGGGGGADHQGTA